MPAPDLKLLGVYLSFVLFPVFFFFSCQGNGIGPTQKIELHLAWWGTQQLHEHTLQAIALYQKQNQNVHINCEYTSWRDYWTKMEAAAGNHALPDIIQHDYTLLKDWVDRELLLPLDELVKSRVIDLRHVPKTLVNVGKVNGKLYGINLGSTAMAWILDEEAFAKAAIPLPAANWTWEDFENISLEFSRKLGLYGFATQLYNYQVCRAYLLGHQEWWYSEDGKSLNYSDENLIKYLKMLIRLQGNNAFTNEEQELIDFNEEKGLEGNPVIAQKAAMAYMWTNHLMAIQEYLGKTTRKLKLQPLPRPRDGQSSDYIKPSMFFTINRESRHAKEAARFINWFINSLPANKLLLAERGIPVSRKIQQGLKPFLNPLQRQIFDYIAYIAENGTPTPPADPEANTAVRDNIYYLEVVDPVMYMDRTPEEAAAIFRLMATEVLVKN